MEGDYGGKLNLVGHIGVNETLRDDCACSSSVAFVVNCLASAWALIGLLALMRNGVFENISQSGYLLYQFGLF